ncbi:MAG: DnaJ domain-containing protein [Erysipelotrichales bacterium]
MNFPKKEDNYARQRAKRERRQRELEKQQESTQQNSEIIQCVPAIDLLCNVALTYEANWTPQKVRLIKTVFENFCKTSEDQEFLKNRIKLTVRPALDRSISDFIDMQHSEEDIDIIYNNVVILVSNTCNDKDEIFHKCLNIGTSLGIDYNSCHENITQYLEKIGFYNQFNQEESSKQKEQNNHACKDELEAAARILDISTNASINEIKDAYRVKIKDFHPDRNVNVTPAVKKYLEEQSILINNAKDTLLSNLK